MTSCAEKPPPHAPTPLKYLHPLTRQHVKRPHLLVLRAMVGVSASPPPFQKALYFEEELSGRLMEADSKRKPIVRWLRIIGGFGAASVGPRRLDSARDSPAGHFVIPGLILLGEEFHWARRTLEWLQEISDRRRSKQISGFPFRVSKLRALDNIPCSELNEPKASVRRKPCAWMERPRL